MTVSHLLLALVAPAVASAAHWAVIVAGSNGFFNYRHQADVCHAYQIMKAKGTPEDNIILMAYDDIANNDENPFKGKLFNAPDPKGPGVDVYAGCKIDYKGADVNAKKFLSIIQGEGSGKVLKSTEEYHVFLNFVDHGAPGLIAFPDTELHKQDLQNALATMHSKKMFKSLIFYLETCYSGSMFEGLNVPGVYAVSAANPKESSYGTYCDDNVVNGKSIGTCLGDLFSVSWMQNIDTSDTTSETLEQQYTLVKKLTNKSHVMQYGDETFTSDTLSEYVGAQTGKLRSTMARSPSEWVKVHHIDLHMLYRKYEDSASSKERMATAKSLQLQLSTQYAVESAYWRLVELAYPGDEEKQHMARELQHSPKYPECELAGHQSIREHCADQFEANSGFALHFHQVVVNICHDIAERGLNLEISGAAQQACGKVVIV